VEAADVVQRNAIDADWDPETLRSAAAALARGSTTSSRLLALDALEKGDIDLLALTSLSEPEKAWIRALHFARSQPSQALDELMKLPAGGYPEKALVIARVLNATPPDETLRARLREHLDAFREDPLSNLLWHHLGDEDESLPDWLSGTNALLHLLPPGDEARDIGLALLSVAEGRTSPADFHSIGPAATVLNSWRSIDTPDAATASAAAILSTAWSFVDDLIDGGVLTREALAEPESLPGTVRQYLLGRLTPEELSDEDVAALEFSAERARRAFHSGDESQLQTDDEASQFYQLLHGLYAGDSKSGTDLIPLLTEEAGATATMLVEFLEAPSLATLRDELLDDRSVWSTVAMVTTQETLEVPSRSRLSDSKRHFLEWAALHAARTRLYEWDWQGAVDFSKRCLKVSKNEQVRDEALNLLACAHHQLGNEHEAIQALKSALEGDYTAALQANIGVVAAGLDPRTAAEHLGHLVTEAPTQALRVAAAMRAVALWRSLPEPWEQDEANQEILPSVLREGLRSLIALPLEVDDFRVIVRLLANWDAEWVKNPANLRGSPHANSVEAHLYAALATGYPDFVKALAPALLEHPDAKWLADERDELVEAGIRTLLDDEPSIGAALFGIEIIDARVPLEARRRIPLVALSVATLTANIDSEEGEPKEQFLDWLIAASKDLTTLDQESMERFRGPLEFAFTRIGVSIGAFREKQLNEVVEAYGNITNQLRGMLRWNINRSAVRQATDPLINFTSDTRRLLNKVLPFIVDEELKKAIGAVENRAAEIQNALQQLPR
jgi:tetratricopeptide (TPR) repeat protein